MLRNERMKSRDLKVEEGPCLVRLEENALQLSPVGYNTGDDVHDLKIALTSDAGTNILGSRRQCRETVWEALDGFCNRRLGRSTGSRGIGIRDHIVVVYIAE